MNKIGKGGTPAGGWVLSPADMVRVLVAYDAGVYRLNGDPNAVFYGKNGGITGSSTWVEHLPDGIVFAAFYNGGNGRGAHRAGLVTLEHALDGR
ncbi:MAG: hypothetical protein M3169_04730 [Candidatus Eremiobacteraeota bacterium]|nr:hypothetical protein [Candidatus Eremiobacteraeota bacterium]